MMGDGMGSVVDRGLAIPFCPNVHVNARISMPPIMYLYEKERCTRSHLTRRGGGGSWPNANARECVSVNAIDLRHYNVAFVLCNASH